MTTPRITPTRALLASALATLCMTAGPALAATDSDLPDYVTEEFGHPPEIPTGPVPEDLKLALRISTLSLFQFYWDPDQINALVQVGRSGDPRLAWTISDMMRFTWDPALSDALATTAETLLQIEISSQLPWGEVTDHLIAWDIPAYPGYLEDKRRIFTQFAPAWEPLFVEGQIDWRLVSWGGVQIDNRPFDTTDDLCNCIPAADNPQVTSAAEATWLDDDDIVFGIELNGEARAYPRQIMEVREMVNDTLGGRDLGIPYCTLCGAAQAWFTDDLSDGVERPVLRTSGMLIRSNKVMYDLVTMSVFDTFKGHAVTGPLADKGVALKQATVITTDWGTWKETYPDTTVLAEYLSLGRNPDFRNGRDANGPIFPVGDTDPRLPVHEDVIGVIAPSGQPYAFQRTAAIAALSAGQEVTVDGLTLELVAGGVRAKGTDGADLGSHEAFWFAWSQFHPTTELWPGS